MPSDELYLQWKREEDIAHIEGWDFSHIEGRYAEDADLPWGISKVIGRYLDDSMMLLAMENGGGEFYFRYSILLRGLQRLRGMSPMLCIFAKF